MEIVSTLKSLFGGIAKTIEKNKADILFNIGRAGGVTAVVLTAVETPKVIEEWNEWKKESAKVYLTEPDEEQAEKKAMKLKVKGLIVAASKYAPAAGAFALSNYCYKRSHDILKADNADLMALVLTTAQAYNVLEKKLEGKVGEDKANEIRFDASKEKIETVDIQEDGTEKKSKKAGSVIPEDYDFNEFNRIEPYQRWFTPDTSSKYIETSRIGLRNINTETFKACETMMTIALRMSHDKVLQMDRVLEDLGFYKDAFTKFSYMACWSYNETNPRGDNCVKIKWTEYYQARRYFDDIEQKMETRYIPIYLLEFNVDGNILDAMERKEQ